MRMLEGPAARMASAERSAHLQDDQNAPLSPREEEAHAHWSGLTPALQAHVAELFDGKQRLFLRMFAFDSGLCLRRPWSDFQCRLHACAYQHRPPAAELVQFARKFLGLFMINRFDILMFLEDAGLWMERGSSRRPLSDTDDDVEWDDDDDENGDAAERKYAPAAFEAAGLAVAGLLRLLAAEGFYSKEDLAPGLAIAEQAAVELPRCALLGAYLPGPLNVVKDVLLTKQDEAQPPVLEEVEAGVVEKYRHIAPRFNFRRACASVLASDLRVEHSEQRRMRVLSVEDRRRVTFQEAISSDAGVADGAEAAPPPDTEQEHVMVEMDPEIGALLLPGMTVTGHFFALSDGSWYFAQPGYVWPSYYHTSRSHGAESGSLSDPESSDGEDGFEY